MCQPLRAQTLEYTRVDVAGRLFIAVPAHWKVRDINERRNIAAAADAMRNPTTKPAEPMHVSSLSVVSTPDPPKAIIRISLISEQWSQAELRDDLQRNRQGLFRELAEAWEKEKLQVASTLASQGLKYLGQERFAVESIDNKLAVVISYKRSAFHGNSPFVVTQYQIPMGEEKILVTLSYQESAAPIVRPILQRVKNSIAIR